MNRFEPPMNGFKWFKFSEEMPRPEISREIYVWNDGIWRITWIGDAIATEWFKLHYWCYQEDFHKFLDSLNVEQPSYTMTYLTPDGKTYSYKDDGTVELISEDSPAFHWKLSTNETATNKESNGALQE